LAAFGSGSRRKRIWRQKRRFDVIKTLKYRFERMQKIYADGGYQGDELAEKLKKELNYNLE
jgi:IS5 family transposase